MNNALITRFAAAVKQWFYLARCRLFFDFRLPEKHQPRPVRGFYFSDWIKIMKTVQCERRLRLREVQHQCGLGRTSIYKRIREGTFPPQRKDGGVSYWLLSEVQEWILQNAKTQAHE